MNMKLDFVQDDENLDLDFAEEVRVIGAASAVRLSEVKLLAAAWRGNGNLYSQVVNINGITANSLVDLQPSAEQLQIFHEKDLAFTTENNKGVVTVFAIGDRPLNDYTIQATITEVRV